MNFKRAIYIGGILGVALAIAQLVNLHRPPAGFDDTMTLAQLIKNNAAWPCDVVLTEQHTIFVIEKGFKAGFVVLEPGITLKASNLADDGMLSVRWADLDVSIPFEKTDFFYRVVAPRAIRVPATDTAAVQL